MSAPQGERKHSKYGASGSERWEKCPGSVALSEGIPSKDTPWSLEGTKAHEVLETVLRAEISGNDGAAVMEASAILEDTPQEMIFYAQHATDMIMKQHELAPGSDVLVETRILLDFIHPEAFGTFDAAVVDHFGTLNVFDYKYGAGHAVSATENMQMAFYGVGLAHKYDWNFKRVRLWIIQPRIRGYDGPTFWELPTMELKTKWVDRFRRAVDRVEKEPNTYVEGGHCHWCSGKKVCPLKTEARLDKAKAIFGKG
jgi:hypothetical protein